MDRLLSKNSIVLLLAKPEGGMRIVIIIIVSNHSLMDTMEWQDHVLKL